MDLAERNIEFPISESFINATINNTESRFWKGSPSSLNWSALSTQKLHFSASNSAKFLPRGKQVAIPQYYYVFKFAFFPWLCFRFDTSLLQNMRDRSRFPPGGFLSKESLVHHRQSNAKRSESNPTQILRPELYTPEKPVYRQSVQKLCLYGEDTVNIEYDKRLGQFQYRLFVFFRSNDE